ncbi:MAG: hypothetical protein ACTSV0_06680 [Candidatus Freyarchaeota archaeon]
MDFGVNYPLIILSVIVGTVVGSVIAIVLDLFLRGFEREARLAVKNKLEIYEPLYNEIEKIRVSIETYQLPKRVEVSLENPLHSWAALPHSVKRRAPKDLADLITDFSQKVGEYFHLYLEAGKVLRFYIRDVLKRRRRELEMDDQELSIIEAKLYDAYSSDFYSGRVLDKKHSYELEDLIRAKNTENIHDIRIVPMSIFNEICSLIEKDRWPFQSEVRQHRWIKEFRESQSRLMETIEKIKKNLEEKMDYITENYEDRYSLLRILKNSLLGKRMKV